MYLTQICDMTDNAIRRAEILILQSQIQSMLQIHIQQLAMCNAMCNTEETSQQQ